MTKAHPGGPKNRPGPRRARAVVALIAASALAACSPALPKIAARRLARSPSVEIETTVVRIGPARSGAYTRGEGARDGAIEGAAGAAEVAFSDPLGLILLPIILPTAVVFGTGAGAATGTSMSRTQIDAAMARLEAAFDPTVFTEGTSRALADAFARAAPDGAARCYAPRSRRSPCPPVARAVLRAQLSVRLVPAAVGAGSGGLDFSTRLTLRAEPRGTIVPDCVSWRLRRRAGNLFDLAASDGGAANRAFAAHAYRIASDAPSLLFEPQMSEEYRKAGWRRIACDTAPPRNQSVVGPS